MVNKIKPLSTYELEEFRKALNKSSVKFNLAIDFKPFNSATSITDKPIIYRHSKQLHIATTIHLLLFNFIKQTTLSDTPDTLPAFYFDFWIKYGKILTELKIMALADKTLSDEPIEDLIPPWLFKIREPIFTELSQNLKRTFPTHLTFKLFEPPLCDLFNDILKTPRLTTQNLDTLSTLIVPPLELNLTTLELFNNIRDIHELLSFLVPHFKRKYHSIYPAELFKGRNYLKEFQTPRIMALGQIRTIEEFLTKIYKLFNKNNSISSIANFSNQIKKELFDFSIFCDKMNQEQTGLKFQQDPKQIELFESLCRIYSNSPNQTVAELGLDLDLHPKYLEIFSKLTIYELKILTNYLKQENEQSELYTYFIDTPLYCLTMAGAYFRRRINMRHSKSALLEIFHEPRIPRFRNFYTESSFEEIFAELRIDEPKTSSKQIPIPLPDVAICDVEHIEKPEHPVSSPSPKKNI